MMWQPVVQPIWGDENFYYRTSILLGLVAVECFVLLLWTMFKLGRANKEGKTKGWKYVEMLAELDRQEQRIYGLKPLPGGVMLSATYVEPPSYKLIKPGKPYRQIRAHLHQGIVDGGENAVLIARVYLVDHKGRHIFGPPVDSARIDKGPAGEDLIKIVFRPCTFESPFIAARIVLATPDDGHAFEDQSLAGEFQCQTGESLSMEITWQPEPVIEGGFEEHRAQDSTAGLAVSEVCKDEPNVVPLTVADDVIRDLSKRLGDETEAMFAMPPPRPPSLFDAQARRYYQATTQASTCDGPNGRLGF
jgi:hypothetical protein